MNSFHRRCARILCPAVLFLGFSVFLRADTPPFACTAESVPTLVRAEALADPLGDLVLVCTGGTPTPAGQVLPQFNFTVFLNTNVTSVQTAASQFSEALLLVDEPNSPGNPNRSVLNCGNAGAPDSGASGPGVCSIVSTGDPASSYDATPNGYGTGVCDGAGGSPAANSYGCGRPNAFQGRIGTAANPGQSNAVTFFSVPVDPPGAGVTRTFRITNLRANAVPVSISQTPFENAITGTIAVTGPAAITISGPQQLIGYVQSGMTSSSSCQPTLASRVRVCEGFNNAWRFKNISFLTGDHNSVPGNGSIGMDYVLVYSGGTGYPADVAQNVAGANYNSESLYQWQNNSANAPPNPNPPPDVGVTALPYPENYPLNSTGAGGFNTGISVDGVANAGTRIAVQFTGIPAGATVQVPTVLYFWRTGDSSYSGDPTTLGSSSTGVMVLANTDSSGAGAFQAAASGTLAVSGGSSIAVYEVLFDDPNSLEFTEVPYTLVNAPVNSTVETSVSFAPFYSTSAASQSSATLPVPRFMNGICPSQNCIAVSPDQGTNTGPVSVSFTGNSSLSGSQVTLTAAGLAAIPGTDLSSPEANTLNATFNLTGAATGARDIVITPPSGPAITLAGDFAITTAPACAFTAAPQNPSFTTAGGTGALVISATPAQCSWSASTATDWITLSPVSASQPEIQSFDVAANSGASSRTGSIDVAGQVITVTQDGTATCKYSISPGSNFFPVGGGPITVNVTAPSGCNWTASSTLSWLSVTAGAAGSGNGSVTLTAAANTGATRSGTITIAGQTFTVNQSATACGATDVSSSVAVTQDAALGPFTESGFYTKALHILNNGAAVAGPVYVVLDGICSNGELCAPVNTAAYTTCEVPVAFTNTPMVLVATNGLSANQAVTYTLQFQISAPARTFTTRVLSGKPSQ